ncbi:MAG: KamA family radical SAM protein [Verrucomicrobia bacterium]|nr:KamA family radical SAM protein [Verrucomicrobiota bacterium]
MSFRAAYFPGVSDEDWSDWRWQMRNALKSKDDLGQVFDLTADEIAALDKPNGHLPVSVTPYYASLIPKDDSSDPLRRTMIPVMQEFVAGEGESDDPLGEQTHSPVPGIVHTYKDKVLFLATDFCATYCRYCTRARLVGSGGHSASRERWGNGLQYIESHPGIRDVLISGGDPLTIADDKLDWLLGRLHGIEHIEIIRIGTKIPAVLPQRITPELCDMLRKYHPLWMSVHFTHPNECTSETEDACALLADAGIPLCSQTVLLKGVNDDLETMRTLMHTLLRFRVKPYYLLQCDLITGSSHFRTPVQAGLDIIKGLHGHTTGYAVPTYVIDAPGGGGKVPVSPDYVVGEKDGKLLLLNHLGETYTYPK